MAQITALRPRERLLYDEEPLLAMRRSLGAKRAELVIQRAGQELRYRLLCLRSELAAGELLEGERQLRRIQRMAEPLGLCSVAQVAGDVVACWERCSPAFDAVVGRSCLLQEAAQGGWAAGDVCAEEGGEEGATLVHAFNAVCARLARVIDLQLQGLLRRRDDVR